MTQERETALAVRDVAIGAGSENENQNERISFSIPKRGIHGILCPDDGEKSALLRLLAGIDEPRQGSVEIGGVPLSYGNTALRRRVAYVPAAASLVGSMTLRETLEFAGNAKGVGAELLPRQIKEAEELLELSDLDRRLVRRLSASERWRLTLAMALLGNPDILLLEEPSRSRDAEESAEWRRELLTMLGRIKTVVPATSSYSLARELCEDVILLFDGAILAQGSFEELERRLVENGSAESLETVYRMLCAAAAESREEVAE